MLCVVIRAAERRRSGAVLWSVDIQEKFFLEPVSVWILASHNWEEGGRRGPGGESWRAAPVEPALLATILDKISLSLFPASLFPGSSGAGRSAVHPAAPA